MSGAAELRLSTGSIGVLVADRFPLSGDTLFVEGTGRPDREGHVEEWALDLHRTLTGRLAGLGDLRTHAEFTANVDQFLADVLAGARPAPGEDGLDQNQCAAGGATAG